MISFLRLLHDRIHCRLVNFVLNLVRASRFAWWGWNDYDYEGTRLFEVMDLKLRMMEQFFLSDSTTKVGTRLRAAEIASCRRALQHIIQETPVEQAFEEFGWGARDFPRGKFKKMCHREEFLWKERFRKLSLILERRLRYWWD